MKLALVGGRYYDDFDAVLDKISAQSVYDINDVTEIVSGGANGVDTIAKRLASVLNVPFTVFKPDWKQYGRAAGPIRNKLIIETADIVHAFWDGNSKGTKSAIGLAKKANKTLLVTSIPTEEQYMILKSMVSDRVVYTELPGFAKRES